MSERAEVSFDVALMMALRAVRRSVFGKSSNTRWSILTRKPNATASIP